MTHQIENIEEDQVPIPEDTKSFSFKKLWAFAGPGLLMSIAYLDPGNLEGDLQAGVVGGHQLLWILFWATCAGFLLQILAARLGVVTGKDLATICREEYPNWASKVLWVMTEIAIIGSDIQEVIGSAIAMNILFGLPIWAGVIITACDTFTFLMLHILGVRKLEAFFGALIGTMGVCFLINWINSGPDFAEVGKGLVIPIIPSYAWTQAVALIGAVIMPHNIYFHSALVQSRRVDRNRPDKVQEANKYFAIESGISLLISFIINLAVVAVFANGFYNNPKYIGKDVGLEDAGDALYEQFGRSAQIIWGVGLLAAGQSATMTGTFSGQFVMQGFLDLKVAPWVRTLMTRSVAIVPALCVALLFEGSDSIRSGLNQMGELLNVLQSMQLPFALLPVLKFTSSSKRMGEFKSHRAMKVICWVIAAIVIGMNFYHTIDQVQEWTEDADKGVLVACWLCASIFLLFYIAFLAYVAWRPVQGPKDEPAPTSLNTPLLHKSFEEAFEESIGLINGSSNCHHHKHASKEQQADW
eukprot:GILJ01010136.1.p1 GENE.GILJ01010136.1~~GILJ01010136.1.p1  ORF type:complete len:526 (-),score=73.23 GILJ01010136.1:169-1746(-)